jgi:hypothetical protein
MRSLMRGDGWVRCCVCGALHVAPYPGLARDVDGSMWDVCEGECAVGAGIVGDVTAPDTAPRSTRRGRVEKGNNADNHHAP